MINLYKDFVPGDLIEFVYDHNNQSVDNNEELFSSTMNGYVRIAGPILFVCQDRWIALMVTSDGFIHTLMDDKDTSSWNEDNWKIHPRLIKGQELDR